MTTKCPKRFSDPANKEIKPLCTPKYVQQENSFIQVNRTSFIALPKLWLSTPDLWLMRVEF